MAENLEFKKRRKIIERILRNWQNWGSLVESQNLTSIVIDGEEYHYYDMLDGLLALPPRQRQAVWYMCVEDKSESETAEIMGFTNPDCTPCQQYKSFGVTRFIKYLDSSPEEQEQMIESVKKYGKTKRKKRSKKETL